MFFIINYYLQPNMNVVYGNLSRLEAIKHLRKKIASTKLKILSVKGTNKNKKRINKIIFTYNTLYIIKTSKSLLNKEILCFTIFEVSNFNFRIVVMNVILSNTFIFKPYFFISMYSSGPYLLTSFYL